MDNTLNGVDPYKVFGIEKDATSKEIKKTYRRLSKQKHPDHGGTDAEFTLLSLCYAVLMDPDKRAYYDQTGGFKETTSIDKSAQDLLRQLFSQSLGHYGEKIFQMDLMATLSQAIAQAIRQADNRIKTSQGVIKYNERVKAKLRREEDAPDLFESVIDQKILTENQSIAECQEAKEIGQRAQKMLKMYGFDFIMQENPYDNSCTSTSVRRPTTVTPGSGLF